MSQNENKTEIIKNVDRPKVDRPSLDKSLKEKENILKNNQIVKK